MKKSVVVFVLLLCFLSIGFTDLRCSFEKYNFKITNFGNIFDSQGVGEDRVKSPKLKKTRSHAKAPRKFIQDEILLGF